MSRSERVRFNGRIYRRYPDSPWWADRVYFTSRDGQRLHRAVWEHHHGPVPEGMEVHQKNGNLLDNDIENLECLSSKDYRNLYLRLSEELKDAFRDKIRDGQSFSGAWHESPQGIAWHREHNRKPHEKRTPRSFVCEQCRRPFESMASHGRIRFCSNNCKSESRRVSGVDDVIRVCERCAAPFKVNKYTKVRYCSRLCSARSRHRQRA